MNLQRSAKLSAIIPVIDFSRNFDSILKILRSSQAISAEIILVLDNQPQSAYEHAVSTFTEMDIDGVVTRTDSLNPGGARNLGLSLATCDWVVFWDCDDFPKMEHLLEMILKSEKDGCQIAVGSFETENIITGEIKNMPLKPRHWQIDVGLNPGIWRFAFKRELVSSITFPELKMGEDQVFLQRVFAKNPKVSLSEGIVYRYRIGSPNQLTSNSRNLGDLISANKIAKHERNEIGRFSDVAMSMLTRQFLTLSRNRDSTIKSRLFYIFYAALNFIKNPNIFLRLLNSYRVGK